MYSFKSKSNLIQISTQQCNKRLMKKKVTKATRKESQVITETKATTKEKDVLEAKGEKDRGSSAPLILLFALEVLFHPLNRDILKMISILI